MEVMKAIQGLGVEFNFEKEAMKKTHAEMDGIEKHFSPTGKLKGKFYM